MAPPAATSAAPRQCPVTTPFDNTVPSDMAERGHTRMTCFVHVAANQSALLASCCANDGAATPADYPPVHVSPYELSPSGPAGYEECIAWCELRHVNPVREGAYLTAGGIEETRAKLQFLACMEVGRATQGLPRSDTSCFGFDELDFLHNGTERPAPTKKNGAGARGPGGGAAGRRALLGAAAVGAAVAAIAL